MPQPNFLFLMTDHQQARTVNTGVCQTPNTDRIIDEGVRFNRNYTVNAICSPTRASLFTGLHVHGHGMYDCTHASDEMRSKFRADLPTWSGTLADAGYHNAYFGKWHVERSKDLSQFGWRHFDECRDLSDWRSEPGHDVAARRLLSRSLGGRGYAERELYAVIDEPAGVQRPGCIYDRALCYFEEHFADGDEPWSLFISTPEPHDPYICPAEFYDLYDPDEIDLPASFDDDLDGKPNVLKRMQEVFAPLTEDDFRQAIACYLGVCSMLDHHTGQVLDALQDSGQWDNTVIVCLTDHADMMGAHRLLTKGVTPYEEVYNVPLIIRDPNAEGNGRDTDHVVSIGDVGPTVLELAGCEPFEETHFRSLTPLLEEPGRDDWADEAYAEFHGQRYFFTQRILWRDQLKYVFNAYDFDEMYDLAVDPHEMSNVVDDPAYADRKEDMLRGIWRHVHDTGDEVLANSHYWSLRFFDLGPDSLEHD
ncbi:MAG: sulfatase-like hydrolase/transferase [Armatimonadia bacterium]|nr:sulfatase-like hydrolase/transferase [Armatimonadia bacterium]